jgi:hypothetical protein
LNHCVINKIIALVILVAVCLIPELISADTLKIENNLRVQTIAVKTEDGISCWRLVITLWNQNWQSPLTNLEIKVEIGKDVPVRKNMTFLGARQSLVSTCDLQNVSGNPYLVVSYNEDGHSNSLAQNIELPSPPQASSWPSIIPAIISLAGVAVGGWLTHLFTFRRERRRTEFDWGKMLFERYEKGYLLFLNGWRGFPNADILRRQFQDLQATCFVPARIANIYEQTMHMLLDGQTSDLQKENACKSLRESIDQFITKPWSLFN